MNTAAKGARNEHRSMAVLESAGYRCTRSAASLGAWDIIGISSQDVVLCQVKTSSTGRAASRWRPFKSLSRRRTAARSCIGGNTGSAYRT